jgi:hypothetical protein
MNSQNKSILLEEMSIKIITRTTSVSELASLDQYVIIMTPINKLRGQFLMHLALLDCEKGEILEGINDKGVLKTQVFLVNKSGTIEDYIKRRERAVGFDLTNKENILAQYYWGLANYDENSSIDSEIEKREARWDEMFDIEGKYCANGKYGWSCETVVFYILTGYPISPQGEWADRPFWDNESLFDFSNGAYGFWDKVSQGRLDITFAPYVRKYRNRKRSHWNY